MREAGATIIGAMGGWQQRDFEDCIEPVKYTTKILRTEFKPEGRFPIVSQEADFINGYWDDEADVFQVRKPLVIFGDHTKVLKYVDFDFVLGADGVKILQPCDFLLPKFFYYHLQSIDLEALGYARHYRLLKESKLAHPPLPEQQRIVAILDEAFAGIATAKANAEKNLRNANELFESYQHDVFGQRIEGWEEKSIGELVDDGILAKPQDGNHGEIHPVRADFVQSGVPFIMAADLENGLVNTRDCRFISKTQAKSLRIGFAKDGDVLLSHKGTIGRVAVLYTDQEFVILTPQVTYYRVLDAKRLSNEYLPYYFRCPMFQEKLNEIADGGSTRAYIGITRQLSLPIVVPPLQEQKKLAGKLAGLRTEVQQLESLYAQKLAALDALKKSLLHQAFSGMLSVKSQAEAIV